MQRQTRELCIEVVGRLAQIVRAEWLRDLLTSGPTVGLTTPATLDLRLLSITFGIVFKVNVVGVIGIVLAIIAFRKL